ncbi:hypothetical protein AV903_18065 [Erwinia tracheiphila]|uniref:Uncharacterized protein n=1 Tax=Erwinia tracheiphila TaxID=65700 RepID=A0A345CVP9_9GAMM|nr:hypothetical protein AV903_18065 [Erwinia tracheiphila]
MQAPRLISRSHTKPGCQALYRRHKIIKRLKMIICDHNRKKPDCNLLKNAKKPAQSQIYPKNKIRNDEN